MHFFKDEGVVLRKYRIKEKDEVVILLTKHHGKMAFVSYGSRDAKSRKAGALQLANTIEFQARETKTKMPNLEQVKGLKRRAFELFKDQSIELFYRASEILKLAHVYSQEGEKVLQGYLDLNSALDQVDLPSIVCIFWIRLLTDHGFLPDWSHCQRCHIKISLQEKTYFSTKNNGFSHQKCSPSDQERSRSKADSVIDPNLLKLMSYFQHSSISQSIRVDADQNLLQDIYGLLGSIEV